MERHPIARRRRISGAAFAGPPARLDHALELYNRRLAPLIMTTGGAGGDPIYTEGGVGRCYLISRGVPSEAIIAETEGESTVESTPWRSKSCGCNR